MEKVCPLCGSRVHACRMRFKDGREGNFYFCESYDCDYKEREEDKDESKVKPGSVSEVSYVLPQ